MTQPSPSNKPIVAAFDFDGTITTRDALLPFLIEVAGFWASLRKFTKLSPKFAGYLLHQITRQEVKEEILTRFFAGMPIEQLRELGEAFARSNTLKQLVRPEAKRRIDWHRRQNHRCILISASIDVFLQPWSKRAGFEDLICSQLEVDPGGNVTGRLNGLNCWGPEKQRCLEALLGPRNTYTLYAYGDSRGDKELLAYADFPFYRKMS